MERVERHVCDLTNESRHIGEILQLIRLNCRIAQLDLKIGNYCAEICVAAAFPNSIHRPLYVRGSALYRPPTYLRWLGRRHCAREYQWARRTRQRLGGLRPQYRQECFRHSYRKALGNPPRPRERPAEQTMHIPGWLGSHRKSAPRRRKPRARDA